MTGRAICRGLWGLLALLLAALLYIGLMWFSPLGYAPPEDLPPIDTQRSHQVFAYGTLTQPWVRWLVMGSAGAPREAHLPGYRREGLDGVPDPGAVTEGVVFAVTPAELARLDRYERLGVRYARLEKTLGSGEAAWVYRRLPPENDPVTGHE